MAQLELMELKISNTVCGVLHRQRRSERLPVFPSAVPGETWPEVPTPSLALRLLVAGVLTTLLSLSPLASGEDWQQIDVRRSDSAPFYMDVDHLMERAGYIEIRTKIRQEKTFLLTLSPETDLEERYVVDCASRRYRNIYRKVIGPLFSPVVLDESVPADPDLLLPLVHATLINSAAIRACSMQERRAAERRLAVNASQRSIPQSENRVAADRATAPQDPIPPRSDQALADKTSQTAVTPIASVKANPEPPPQTTQEAVADRRDSEIQQIYASLLAQARAGKLRYLSAANLYREKFLALYPEQTGNPFLMEYLAYMAVVGEKVDRKRLTVTEAEYELARKVSELKERAAATQAAVATRQELATMKARADSLEAAAKEERAIRRINDEAAARRAAEESARRASEEAAKIALEEKRLALQRELASQQLAAAEAQRRRDTSAALMALGLQLLTPPQQPRPQTCTGRWIGNMWSQTCN